MWTDTHCHLDAAEFDADRDAVREAARAAGVTRCVIPAVHAGHWPQVAQLAERHGDAYALGIHPLYVPQAQEADLLAVLQTLTGRSWRSEIKTWVHSTAELPVRPLLTAQGLVIHDDEAQMAQRLGLRVVDGPAGVHIKVVLRGGAAEQAGLACGDEWLGVDVGARGQGDSWRLHKLDDLKHLLGTEKRFTAWVSRDQRLLRLPLTLPAKAVTWRLAVPASRPAGQWPAV